MKLSNLIKNRDSIVLCLSSDLDYLPHLWVTLWTIMNSAKSNHHYYIFILDGGIKDKKGLCKLVEKDKRFHIEFIDMTNQFASAFESRNVTRAAYYRLAIFKLFKNFKKVIYLDADSYVLGDLSELWDTKIDNKSIAGVVDSITYEIPWREKYISYHNYTGKAMGYFGNYLKLSNDKLNNYFSSGVLVFNIEKIDIDKKQKILEKLLENDYFCHDQDILNLLFNEKETYLLGREWNYFNSGQVLKEEDFSLSDEKLNYLGGKVKPKIVSYVLKPWFKENSDMPYVKEYWEVLKKSPYYNKVNNEMLNNTRFKRFMKLSFIEKCKFIKRFFIERT